MSEIITKEEWLDELPGIIADEFGEPELPTEHCKLAAMAVSAWMESLEYTDLDDVSARYDAYIAYLFAKWSVENKV